MPWKSLVIVRDLSNIHFRVKTGVYNRICWKHVQNYGSVSLQEREESFVRMHFYKSCQLDCTELIWLAMIKSIYLYNFDRLWSLSSQALQAKYWIAMIPTKEIKFNYENNKCNDKDGEVQPSHLKADQGYQSYHSKLPLMIHKQNLFFHYITTLSCSHEWLLKKSQCSLLSLNSQMEDRQIFWYTQDEEHLAGEWEVDFS